MAKVGALMLKVTMEQPTTKRSSFVQNFSEIFVWSELRKLPQFEQKFSKFFKLGLHFGHCGCSCDVGNTCIFIIFSAMRRISNIPMKISSRPATVWKISMATSSPNQYPTDTIVVMRIMFKISNVKNPSINTPIFFQTGAEATKARKAANMAKAMKVYIPEHAKSIANDKGCPVEVVSAIVGDP